MTRLTNQQRDQIRAGIVDETFRSRSLRLRQREHALAVRMLRERYGDDLFERIAKLPNGWLPTTNRVRFEGSPLGPSHLMLMEYAPLPAETSWSGTRLTPSDALIAESDALVLAREQMHDEREQLNSVIRSALASMTTVEQLADRWPEGYRHLPTSTHAVASGLPALRIEDVNARIAAAKEAA